MAILWSGLQVWSWPSTYLNKCFKWTTVPNFIVFWNPCINVEVMTRTNSIYDRFIILIFKCDPDLQPFWTNISNGTSTPQGELYQIILKSMHKCRSSGQDKLNLWPFSHLTFKCDLDLQPTRTNISNNTATPQGKTTVPNYFGTHA